MGFFSYKGRKKKRPWGLEDPGTPELYSQLQEDEVFLAGHKHIYQLQDVRVLHPSKSERSQYGAGRTQEKL